MEEITKIAKLLGEDNEKKLKDGITELLLNKIEDELDDLSDWLLDCESLIDEVREEIFEIAKKKMIEKYSKQVEQKIDELLSN